MAKISPHAPLLFVLLLLLFTTATATATASPPAGAGTAAAATFAFGATIGNGLAGIPICGSSKPPSVVVDYSLDSSSSGFPSGVMHHFWCTGAQYKIDRMWVEYYVDGEATPSVSFQPSMMCGLAFPTRIAHDYEYSAGGLCGKSAPVGGWWNTFPIPFYKSIKVTVRADPSDGPGCFGGYVNVRGTPNLPLVLPISGIPLPAGTRMQLQKNPLAVRQPLEYVPLAQLPAGSRGLVFATSWGVQTDPAGGNKAGGGYIEGCWQFYRQANETFPGLVVGTGVEDYFDSGYYFGADSGDPVGVPFHNALSGLPLFERTADGKTERVSAYRFHTSDPLVMSDGGKLVWRVGAKGEPGTTKCGNPLPKPAGTRGGGNDGDDGIDWGEVQATLVGGGERRVGEGAGGGLVGRQLTAINVTTYAWIYVFP